MSTRRKEPQPALGRALRELREGKGLSQEAVARRTGMHLTGINRLENGRTNPTWGSIKRVAAALGVSVAEVANRAEAVEGTKEKAPRRGGPPGG
ncbi:MAG TPA: helix-turn-helix transcriptional regulator [Solirubrobacterales bacterium]|nr:helix-turn-helix transcriptional regulator [Solirubrobacterales bacterium]